jgi:hypothetical protein
VTVLICFAEAFAAIEAAWSLQRSGMRVEAIARKGTSPALRRVRDMKIHYVDPPELGIDSTLAQISKVLGSVQPDAFLPLDDAALWLTPHLDFGGCAIAGPNERGVAFALNKATQLSTAHMVGLAVPETTIFDNVECVDVRQWPLILKPADAVRVERGRLVRPAVRICANKTEMDRARDVLGDGVVMVQPVIEGKGEGVFGYSSSEGPQQWSGHRRVRMTNPSGSASSACESLEVMESIKPPVAEMLETLGWRGLFMAEFLCDGHGTRWFMELNGRAWGSLALARRRGYEYPAWTVQDVLGLRSRPPPPSKATYVLCRHLGREIAHAVHVLRGPSTSGVASWPRRGPTFRQMLTVRTTDRLYNWDWRYPSVLAMDTWRTVTDEFVRLRQRR